MKPKMKTTTTLLAAAVAAISFSFTSPAHAVDFSGKKITLIVPFKEGGATDTVARLFQPYLQKTLPGNPSVIVLNQPGGGGIKSGNKFEASAPKDGTALIFTSTSTILPFTLGANNVKFDPTGWEAVMGMPRGAVMYTNAEQTGVTGHGKDPKADVAAMKNAKVVNGAKTPISSELLDSVAMDMLGINLTPVFGISTGKQRQAFQRGETNLNVDGTGAYLTKMAKSDKGAKATPLFTYGEMQADGSIGRDVDMPELPSYPEFYKAATGKDLSGIDKKVFLNLFANKVTLSKAVFLPAGTPKEIVTAYVDAFKAMYADPELKKALEAKVGAMNPNFGDDTNKAVRTGLKMDDASHEWLDKFVQRKFNVNL